MKKAIIIGIVILVVSAAIYFFVGSRLPISIETTFEGVYYQLGTENTHNSQTVKIVIDGKLSTENNVRKFNGNFKFDGLQIDQYSNGVVNMFLDDENGDLVGDLVFKGIGFDYAAYRYRYGKIFVNDDFTQFTILVDNEYVPSWNSETGFMISAPATNREEALQISNELMKGYLEHRGMKLE